MAGTKPKIKAATFINHDLKITIINEGETGDVNVQVVEAEKESNPQWIKKQVQSGQTVLFSLQRQEAEVKIFACNQNYVTIDSLRLKSSADIVGTPILPPAEPVVEPSPAVKGEIIRIIYPDRFLHGGSVHFELKVKNTGSSAYVFNAFGTMRDEAGDKYFSRVSSKSIKAGATANIDVAFGTIPNGLYDLSGEIRDSDNKIIHQTIWLDNVLPIGAEVEDVFKSVMPEAIAWTKRIKLSAGYSEAVAKNPKIPSAINKIASSTNAIELSANMLSYINEARKAVFG